MTESVLIFDADVLITLAQYPANIDAIKAIKKTVENRAPWRELVIADCVRDAYQREKLRAVQGYWGAQRTTIKALRSLGSVLPDKNKITIIADELDKEISRLEQSVPETMAAVDELIASARVVPTTTEMWAEAARRFRNDIPPGTRSQKSSITDCVLWQVVLGESSKFKFIFCSNNKKDFSSPDHEEKLHPRLVDELASAKYCYHSLNGFRKHHLKSVNVVVVGPVFDPAAKCYYCGADTEPGLIARPSTFVGWSYQKFCKMCGKYSDTGEPLDD